MHHVGTYTRYMHNYIYTNPSFLHVLCDTASLFFFFFFFFSPSILLLLRLINHIDPLCLQTSSNQGRLDSPPLISLDKNLHDPLWCRCCLGHTRTACTLFLQFIGKKGRNDSKNLQIRHLGSGLCPCATLDRDGDSGSSAGFRFNIFGILTGSEDVVVRG